MDRHKYLFFIIISFIIGLAGLNHRQAFAEQKTVSIGVLARRGAEECLREWSPTAQFLTEQIPGTVFKIVPLPFEAVMLTVQRGQVDFIVVNSSIYVEMQALYDVKMNSETGNIIASASIPFWTKGAR